MTSASADPADYMSQLVQLRKLALANPGVTSTIIPSVLAYIGEGHPLEQRRWGASFLAETYASPVLPVEEKQTLALSTLPTLRSWLDAQGEDAAVVKGAVQIATSIYPLVFKHTIFKPNDTQTWQHMAAIKTNILRRMDASPSGVRVACIKFIQRVVQVQTPGLIQDPRRSDHNELSLSLVPTNHPLITPPNLEAEAFGLLDRLLSVFQEAQSDALYVTATLNCIGTLVRTRASIANRILNAVLNFDPFRVPPGPVTPRMRVMVRSMERTTRAFLVNLNKRNPNHPFAPRVQGYIDRLQQQRLQTTDSRKRAATSEPLGSTDASKRQRTDAPQYPPLPPGPVSIAQIFTLTNDPRIQAFDASTLPIETVNRVLEPVLLMIPQEQLDIAINAVRTRWLSLSSRTITDSMTDNTSASLNSGVPGGSQGLGDEHTTDLAMGTGEFGMPADGAPYKPPEAEAMTPEEQDAFQEHLMWRQMQRLRKWPDVTDGLRKGTVLKRSWESSVVPTTRDTFVEWLAKITLMARIGSFPKSHRTNDEYPFINYPARKKCQRTMLRQGLFDFVIENFRTRLAVATIWLWREKIAAIEHKIAGDYVPEDYFTIWFVRLIDTIFPYVDANDEKILLRFFNEAYTIPPAVIPRIEHLANDPDRVPLVVNILHFICRIHHPTLAALALDSLQSIYEKDETSRSKIEPILYRQRPDALPEEARMAQKKAIDRRAEQKAAKDRAAAADAQQATSQAKEAAKNAADDDAEKILKKADEDAATVTSQKEHAANRAEEDAAANRVDEGTA